jgi:hypothetical protein
MKKEIQMVKIKDINKLNFLYNEKNPSDTNIAKLINHEIKPLKISLKYILNDKTEIKFKINKEEYFILINWEEIDWKKISNKDIPYTSLDKIKNNLKEEYYKIKDPINKQITIKEANKKIESHISLKIKFLIFYIKSIFIALNKETNINIYKEQVLTKKININNKEIEVSIISKFKKDLSININVSIKYNNAIYLIIKNNDFIINSFIDLKNSLWDCNFLKPELVKRKNKRNNLLLLRDKDNISFFNLINIELLYKSNYFFSIDFKENSIYNIISPDNINIYFILYLEKELKENPKE